jgi:hypothetical protein
VTQGKDGSLVIAGFLGRGNAGDEAMFQVLVEQFRDRFAITALVDELGAYPGYRGWYPYAQVTVAHQNHIDTIERRDDCAGLIVGGGMLSLGFAAGHVLMARARKVPVVMGGVDAWPVPFPDSPKFGVLQGWYGMFDRLVMRTGRSVADLRAFGFEAAHGGDWALKLMADSAAGIEADARQALVVLREDSMDALGDSFPAWAEGLLADIARAGYRPVLLPFSPEDERFVGQLGLAEKWEVQRAWWNARRLKQLIGSSGLLVTVGRLHPMIFGAPTACAIASVRMPHWVGRQAGNMLKLNDMAAELGIATFDTRADFAGALAAGAIGRADPDRVAASIERVDRALAMMHRLFKRRTKKPAEVFMTADTGTVPVASDGPAPGLAAE